MYNKIKADKDELARTFFFVVFSSVYELMTSKFGFGIVTIE